MTTWTQVHQTTGVGPTSAVAAGATLQDGWIDASGNQWIVASDGYFQNSVAPSPTNPWQNAVLKRPTAEALQDAQIQARVKYTPGTTADVYLMLRITGNAGAFSGYIAAFNTNQVKAYKMTGGTPSAVSMTGTGSFTPVLNTLYDMQFNIVTSGASTILTFNIYDIGTQALLYSSTGTDSTVALQGVSGVQAICTQNLSSSALDTAQIITTYTSGVASTATALTMTGPTSGVAGTASTIFTVTPNAATAASTIVTPSDGGAGGTFSPTSLTFALGATVGQTFTYTAASAGAKTISITNNQSLTNPANITFTASASSAATTYTLSGPTGGTQGVASTNFTVTASGTIASAVVVTPSDGGAGGTFSPTTVTLAVGSATSATFTYTPASAGAKTISTTNNSTLTNPSSLTYTAAALATTYTFTGPSTASVGSASSNFTVTATGILSSGVVVTPSDGGAGGTFTPTTVTMIAGTNSAATFTYTPGSAGTDTISVTNGGSLTNPSSISVTATASTLITIAVTSPAFRFSPGNWKGDTGRGGSVYRQSWNNGAYFEFTWNASSSPTATILLPTNASNGNYISYYLNGVLTDNVAAKTGNISLTGIIPSASNTLRVMMRSSTQSGRWNNGTSAFQVQGMQLDSGSSAGTAVTYNKWIRWVGDSITEGVKANASADDNLSDYSYLVSQTLQTLGYDYGITACASNGWLQPGDTSGDIPAWYNVTSGGYQAASSRWNLIDQGVSILDSNNHISAYGGVGQEPAIVFMNLMTNESLHSLSPVYAQAAVSGWLVAERAAAPNAHIFMQIPFGLYNTTLYPVAYINALKAGIAAYQAAYPADTKVTVIDFGPATSVLMSTYISGVQGFLNTDSIHPTVNGHAYIAPMVLNGILTGLAADNATAPVLLTQPIVRWRFGL
jgi:hypothetical protein